MYLPTIEFLGLQIPTWFIFGWLNILVAKVVILVIGLRRNWNPVQWITLILLYTLGAAIGTLILPSIMGTLGGGILFLLVGKRWLRFPYQVGDIIALGIALVISLGRLGCFFNGCCFGSPTQLPWGVQYPIGTPAHWLHYHTGQISTEAITSLTIHPIQLYESAFLLFSALIIVKLGYRLKNKNTLLIGFFGSYLLFRFFMEFIRDMTNVWWSVLYFGPLSLFQWFLVAAGVLALIGGYLLERRPAIDPPPKPVGHGRVYGPAVVVVGSLLGATLLHKQLQPIHLVQFLILIPLTTLTLVWPLVQQRPYRRLSLAFTTALAIILMLPLITQLRAQLEEQPITHLQAFRKLAWVYTVHPQTGTLVRLGDESLSYAQVNRITGTFSRLVLKKDGESIIVQPKALIELRGGQRGQFSQVVKNRIILETEEGEILAAKTSDVVLVFTFRPNPILVGYVTGLIGFGLALESTKQVEAYECSGCGGGTEICYRDYYDPGKAWPVGVLAGAAGAGATLAARKATTYQVGPGEWELKIEVQP